MKLVIKNGITPKPKFLIPAIAYLFVTFDPTKHSRFLWFVPSLGIRSPCFQEFFHAGAPKLMTFNLINFPHKLFDDSNYEL